MTRLARSASLLVAFSVLASVATVHAECAWVVWAYALGERVESYSIDAAYPTRKECDESVRKTADAAKAQGYDVRGGIPGSPEVIAQKGTTTLKYFCLPDTVDPRGPKGK